VFVIVSHTVSFSFFNLFLPMQIYIYPSLGSYKGISSYLPNLIELGNIISCSRKQSDSCYHLYKNTPCTPKQRAKIKITLVHVHKVCVMRSWAQDFDEKRVVDAEWIVFIFFLTYVLIFKEECWLWAKVSGHICFNLALFHICQVTAVAYESIYTCSAPPTIPPTILCTIVTAISLLFESKNVFWLISTFYWVHRIIVSYTKESSGHDCAYNFTECRLNWRLINILWNPLGIFP